MAAKKKPGAKKPAEKPIPADVHHGRIAEAEAREAKTVDGSTFEKAAQAAEAQAVAVENLALAVNRAADGFQAIGDLVTTLLARPTTGDRASLLDRLVLAAEKQADARLRIASTFEATEARKAREAEADEKRAAELHAQELKAAEDHVATVRGFFARVQAGEVRITPTGPSGGPEVAFGAPPAASPARQVAEAVAREAGLEVLDPPQA